MDIQEKIVQLIRQAKPSAASAVIHEETSLYASLGFDSISFIKFLLYVEDFFSIHFTVTEMEECVIVGRLAAKIKEKQGGAEPHD